MNNSVHTVWKFSLALIDRSQPVVMPKGARVLRVAAQQNEPNLWCLCDPEATRETRKFVVVGTGHPIPSNSQYVGSCDERMFVWHVFELLSDKTKVQP